MYPLIALRAFFLVLFNGPLARRVDAVLRSRDETPANAMPESDATRLATPPKGEAIRRAAEAKKPTRSDALALLAALQREGRLVDFLKEQLTGYSDAQIGAVARDLHRDCSRVVERMFAIQPLRQEAEGAVIEVPAGFDAGVYRMTGNISGTPPFRGSLLHHGWQATSCRLPEWTGSEAASLVVAPAEVEVK